MLVTYITNIDNNTVNDNNTINHTDNITVNNTVNYYDTTNITDNNTVSGTDESPDLGTLHYRGAQWPRQRTDTQEGWYRVD